MSWDVYLFDAPSTCVDLGDLPGDWEIPTLGAASEILDKLRDSFPGVDLSDPTWGHLAGGSWSIELNIGREDPVESLMLHVRGGGDDVVPVVARIATAVGARAWDIAGGAFLDASAPSVAGWHRFQEYRDHVFRKVRADNADGSS